MKKILVKYRNKPIINILSIFIVMIEKVNKIVENIFQKIILKNLIQLILLD